MGAWDRAKLEKILNDLNQNTKDWSTFKARLRVADNILERDLKAAGLRIDWYKEFDRQVAKATKALVVVGLVGWTCVKMYNASFDEEVEGGPGHEVLPDGRPSPAPVPTGVIGSIETLIGTVTGGATSLYFAARACKKVQASVLKYIDVKYYLPGAVAEVEDIQEKLNGMKEELELYIGSSERLEEALPTLDQNEYAGGVIDKDVDGVLLRNRLMNRIGNVDQLSAFMKNASSEECQSLVSVFTSEKRQCEAVMELAGVWAKHAGELIVEIVAIRYYNESRTRRKKC